MIGICICAMMLRELVELYRGTWVYQYGSTIWFFAFYGTVLGSLINTIFLIDRHKRNLKRNALWIFLSAIPVLYIAVMITKISLQDIE